MVTQDDQFHSVELWSLTVFFVESCDIGSSFKFCIYSIVT